MKLGSEVESLENRICCFSFVACCCFYSELGSLYVPQDASGSRL
jgi:hypothetical protein